MGNSWNIANKSSIEQIACRVCNVIDIQNAELSDEFFPAHVSVALIDSILTPRLNYHKVVVPIIERYCNHFGLQRFRVDRMKLPHENDQETLTNLIDHFKNLGPEGFQEEIIKSRFCSPGTSVLKSENILRAAIELRQIGIQTLQDIQCKKANEIKCVLRPLPGIGDRTIHMFLMYVGRDEYVKGDVHVIRFVKNVLNRRQIVAEEAERLVQRAANKLGIAPRLLDYEIWKYSSDSNAMNSSI